MLRLFYKLNFVLIFILTTSVSLFSQIEKGDKDYKKENYEDALKHYQEEWSENPDNEYVAHQMGNCYIELGENVIASEYFKKAYTINPNNTNSKLAYANALLRESKIEESEVFLIKYLEEYPNDTKAKGMLKTVESIREWQKLKPEEFVVHKLENINSEFDDYGPIVYKESTLIFTSNRARELNDFSGVTPDEERHTNLYKTKFSDNKNNFVFDKVELLFMSLDPQNNIGPISFTSDYNKCFFNSTDVVNNMSTADSMYTMKAFYMEFSKGEWSEPISLNLNSDKYSIHHPYIKPDGKTIYFSSDMPGGQGGLDLYYSELKNGVWNKPVNMGSVINSIDNEAFPTFINDDLYFSSNGQIGYGKYDIYRVSKSDSTIEVINLGYPINTSADELFIYYSAENKGFFSSNRRGGMGGDDIYAFTSEKIEYTTIRGRVEFKDFPSDNVRVDLVDENNNIIQTIITNENGEFIFSGLGVNSNYAFNINEEDRVDSMNARFYMLNENGEKVLVLLQTMEGDFNFETLEAEEYNDLPLIPESESLLTIQLRGNVYQAEKGDIRRRVSIYVLNQDKLVVAKGFTDTNGNFSFEELPPQDQYTLVVGDSIPDANIVIVDESDQVVRLAYDEETDEYYYDRLGSKDDFISLQNESGVDIKIKLKENFKVDNIYYDYNKWDINEDAEVSLDRLVKLMSLNPHISIILYSHTDVRGGSRFNLKLSQKRANSAKDYMVSKDIEADRIEAVGMGETDLVNQCENNIDCSEEEHAQNRRTVFVINRK